MKMINVAVGVALMGLSATGGAATVDLKTVVSLPVSVTFQESSPPIAAQWQPTASLTAGEVGAETLLGKIVLGSPGIYAFKMNDGGNKVNPHYGNLVNKDDNNVTIPVGVYSVEKHNGIVPGNPNGVEGWTITDGNATALKLTVRNKQTIKAGTYAGEISVAKISL